MKRQRGKFRDILTKEYLHKEHYLNKRSLKSIGQEIGCDHSTVAYYVKINKMEVQRYDNHGCKNKAHNRWKGFGDISLTYWNNIKNGANQREIPFNIKIIQAWNLYIKQNKQCALSGRPIGFEASKSNTASLDRIDSTKPYDIANVQWVHRDLNFAKQSLTNNQFIQLCQEVTNYQKI